MNCLECKDLTAQGECPFKSCPHRGLLYHDQLPRPHRHEESIVRTQSLLFALLGLMVFGILATYAVEGLLDVLLFWPQGTVAETVLSIIRSASKEW